MLIAVRPASDAPQDAACEPRLEIRVVGECTIALERDAAIGGNDHRCAQPAQFLGERLFEPARTGGEEVVRR